MEYSVVLRQESWNGKLGCKVRSVHPTRSEADKALKARVAKLSGAAAEADYTVMSDRQLAAFRSTVASNVAQRRAAGAVKAAAKRAARAAAGEAPRFVLCNRCGARSKKLCSEFGGLETRRCQAGHEFTYDRWIADRAFWNPIGAARAIYGRPQR